MSTNPREHRVATMPASSQIAKAIHFEDIADIASELPKMVSTGRTYLKVLAYPWGVEFDLCEREGQT